MSQVKPCWIATTPRTGSTFLCHILNNTGLFDPKFIEYFHERSHAEGCPKYSKVHYFQKPDLIPEDAFPDMRYVYLYREDIYRQVVSDYCCQISQCWQVTNEDKPIPVDFGFEIIPRFEAMRVEIPFQKEFLLQIYHDFTRQRHGWISFLANRPVILVEYEDLIADPKTQVEFILDFLEAPPVDLDKAIAECRTVPMDRPEYPDLIKKLKELV